MRVCLAIAIVMVLAASAYGYEASAYCMKDDFSTERLYDTALQYYYYIPCPTQAWFWALSSWQPGEIIGVTYDLAELGAGGFEPPDPELDHTLLGFRVLDFAGYGEAYPDLFGVRFDVWCAESRWCFNPISGSLLWSSGVVGLSLGWNEFWIEPDGVCITPCCLEPGPPPRDPLITITATMVGSDATYPAFAFDNVSIPVEMGCELHDVGCLPALYPRPYDSHYYNMHSGYYGLYEWEHCPPLWFPDPRDTSTAHDVYGYNEMVMTAYFASTGPTSTESTSWGNIKAMYK